MLRLLPPRHPRNKLAVFDARLYAGVRGMNEGLESGGVCHGFRLQFHVTHVLAGALQEMSGIGQGRALKESDVDVRGEDVNVAKRNISQTCDRTAVMHEFADLVAAAAHDFEPSMSDGSQFTGMVFHPGIDGGIVLEGAVEFEQFRCVHGCQFTIGGVDGLGVVGGLVVSHPFDEKISNGWGTISFAECQAERKDSLARMR